MTLFLSFTLETWYMKWASVANTEPAYPHLVWGNKVYFFQGLVGGIPMN